MATAALAALFLCVVWTLSFSGNHSLVTDATEAAKAVPPVGLQSTQIASRDSLQRLDHVREQLALLNGYERDGAPWRLRWGLYFGSSVRQPLRQVYYALFRKLLLLPTQETLITLTSNPPQANDIANYRLVYDGLKADRSTTNQQEKRTRDFLSPVLQKHWLNNRQVDNDVSGLA